MKLSKLWKRHNTEVVVGILLALSIWFLMERREKTNGMKIQKSTVNGRTYKVQKVGNTQKAANALASIEDQLRFFVHTAPSLLSGPDQRLRRLQDNWDGTLSEIEHHQKPIAYTKGKKSIHLCIRDEQGVVQQQNALMFVALHELSHVAEPSYNGHDSSFWKTFKFILELAAKLGIYQEKDHAKEGTTVCQKKLGSSPLTCVMQGTCGSEL